MNLNDPEQPLHERVGALEAAVSALSERLHSLASQVLQHEESFALVSDVARYAPLRDLLAAGRFRDADVETANVLFDCINTTLENVTPEEIKTFPIGPLRIVDQLWRNHSDGKFGFSVQERLYRSLGGTLDTLIAQDVDLYQTFCDRLGWHSEGQFTEADGTDDISAMPEGALPRCCWFSSYGMKITNLLLVRLITADLGGG
ncbi:GUN4 domain-containing protein [Synechococcus sp. 1G10]|uniref:GUN4 domain-containing protein n=1 Tax=Synechococcus sp. 1G10 TaxID=2025605 RepID=UPI000B98AF4A|nr:GUN4 domain-containing protein [Synechococcus sp. 1G10]